MPKSIPSPIKIELNPGEAASIQFKFRVGIKDYSFAYGTPETPERHDIAYTLGKTDDGYFRLYDASGTDITLTHTYRGYRQP